jgi:hypothetical protein
MNREEAQFILEAYRPNAEDARDPQFQEALALARVDPELGRWFAAQQALDGAFANKLRSHPVPADLKAQLLLARSTMRPRVWWRQPAWLAAAACIAFALAVTAARWRPGAGGTDSMSFREAMAAAATAFPHVDVSGLDVEGYRAWLASRGAAADFVLPARLASQRIAACKIVAWRGTKVTMLCVKVGGRHLDVFVADASELPGVSLGATPEFFAQGNVSTAGWHRDGKIYLVAGALPQTELRQLL